MAYLGGYNGREGRAEEWEGKREGEERRGNGKEGMEGRVGAEGKGRLSR